eukprot:CAMPEP_0196719530 /NCGR_PEP_ID=MMETSP1091-20130531/2488_1 /TAXON_ID=302021 /ORGANISM="Rhodomonas sp., Strain CCMP768" /LENGTH=136 /DNA_ID=CAMNT_0042060501 /DNA_START=8 /DNA_END=418 /DNA_ORIENTATION=-
MGELSWNNEDIDTLIIIGFAENDPEKATVPWALANMELARGKKVQVALMFEGTMSVIPGIADNIVQGPPFDGPLLPRITSFMEKGGVVNCCMPCLKGRVAKGRVKEPVQLLDGVGRCNGFHILEMKDKAKTVLQFT